MDLVRNSLISVGTTPVLVSLNTQDKRTMTSIVNTSTAGQTITLSMGQQTTANQGLVLYTGGTWSESDDSGFKCWGGEIWAVADAALGQVSIQERIKG